MPRLRPKQAAFVREYLVDLNATQAAIRAGYKEKSAYSIGSENLKKPQIQAAISEAMAERAKRTEITQDMVVRELACIAFVDPSRIAGFKDGSIYITDTDELDEDERRAVAEVAEHVTAEGGGSRKIKLFDKIRALELLGKHVGMFRPDAGEAEAPLPVKVEINVVDGRGE